MIAALCWGVAIIATIDSMASLLVTFAPPHHVGQGVWPAIEAVVAAACAIGYIRRSVTPWRWLASLLIAINAVAIAESYRLNVRLDAGAWAVMGLQLVTLYLLRRVWLCVPLAREPGVCDSCGYNLKGNTSGRCPECGEPANAAQGVVNAEVPRDSDTGAH